MHKSIVIIFCFLALAGCGTTIIYSADSEGDIDELYAPCVGPIGTSYINHNDEPFLFVTVKKNEGSTSVYLWKHDDYDKKEVTYPSSAILIIKGERVEVERQGSVWQGKKILGSVFYKHGKVPQNFVFDVGSVQLNQVTIEIEPIEFTYEERRFLMCVQ